MVEQTKARPELKLVTNYLSCFFKVKELATSTPQLSAWRVNTLKKFRSWMFIAEFIGTEADPYREPDHSHPNRHILQHYVQFQY
jgi:hypothetical protein